VRVSKNPKSYKKAEKVPNQDVLLPDCHGPAVDRGYRVFSLGGVRDSGKPSGEKAEYAPSHLFPTAGRFGFDLHGHCF
jgi:hypothetical protein